MAEASPRTVAGGRFSFLRRLGAGPGATTWLVRDAERGDECVLKILVHGPLAGAAVEEVRREAESLRAIAHPNVVRLREVIVEPERGLAALAMERVEGRTLLEVAGRGALPRKDLLDILVAAARGLGAIHARGLLHRDVQPRNIIVTGAPGRRSAVVVDLGLAARRGREPPRAVTGTLGFLSPETLLAGVPDHRSDLFSLGAVLYFMVAGEPPVDPQDLLDSLARGEDLFPLVEKRARTLIPEPFGAIVSRLLARYPVARFQSAAEVVEAVNLRCGTGYEVESAEARRPVLTEPPFVGRERERRSVLRHLLPALSGKGDAVVLVRGAEGSGKSRLLEEVARLVEYRGHVVITLRPPAGDGRPFAPLVRGLRRAAHRLPPEVAGMLDGVEAALPYLGEGPEEGAWDRVGLAVLGALEAAAGRDPPPLLVADDLAALDPGTLAVLTRFLRRAGQDRARRLFAVGAPEPVPAARSNTALASALAAVRRSPTFLSMELGPLPRSALEGLVRGLLPVSSLAPETVRRIGRGGGGLPGGVVEIVRSLLEGGRVAYRGGVWTIRNPGRPLPVPRSVAEALRDRVARIPPELRGCLRALALAGGRMDLAIWGRVAGDPGDPGGTAPWNRAGGLLAVDREEGVVRLPSEAMGEALLKDLPPREEVRLCSLLADAARASGRGASPETVSFLLRAGRAEEALEAGPEALRALRLSHRLADAEDLPARLAAAARERPGDPRAAAVLSEAAYLAHVNEEFPWARALAEEGITLARTSSDRRSLLVRLSEIDGAEGRDPGPHLERLAAEGAGPEETARARLALARSRFVQGAWAEAASVLEDLLPSLGGFPALELRALNGLSALRTRAGRLEEGRYLLEQALRIARATGDRTAVVGLLGNLARKEVRSLRYRNALRLCEESLRSLGVRATAAEEVSLLVTRASALEGLGRWHRSRETSVRALAHAEAEGLGQAAAVARRDIALASGMAGAYEEALRHYSLGLQAAARLGNERERRAAYLGLARLHVERGEHEKAIRFLDAASEGTRGPAEFRERVARFLAGAPGMPDAAALEKARGLLAGPEANAWPEERNALRLLSIRALARLGRTAEAAADLEDLAMALRRAGMVDDRARALALSGTVHADRPERAEREVRRAARLARRLENVPARAEVLEECGLFLRGRGGHGPEAEACLAEAVSLYGSASMPLRARDLERKAMIEETGPTWKGLRPEKLAWLVEQTRLMNEAGDPEEVLSRLLDAAMALTGAQRGFLVLGGPADFRVRVARSMEEGGAGAPERALSTSLLRMVLESGKSVVTADAVNDERLSRFFSVRDLRLRSILVVPIRRGSRTLGAFYMDNQYLESVFSDQNRLALELLADQAALAFENAAYRTEVRDLNARLQERVDEQGRELEGIRTTVRSLRKEAKYAYEGIFRKEGPMAEVLQVVDRAVESDVPVLLEGETGTGKELIARAIHLHGPLRDGPFVVVNCAAIPDSLIEAELFGARRGAFTGADADRPGSFRAADGGTIFLDEIGEMPPDVQAAFLRALQFGEFTPLGSTEVVKVRVRVIAATNRDLREMLAARTFREDLYHRIAVFPIRLPPLRERVEDIPGLAALFVRQFAAGQGRGPRRLTARAVSRLLRHPWPGNVRELQNVLHRAVLKSPGDVLGPEDLDLDVPVRAEAAPVLARLQAALGGRFLPRDVVAVRRVLESGRTTLRDYAVVAAVSKSTAIRDLARLVALRVLVRTGRTASARYELAPRWLNDESVSPRGPKMG